MDLYARVDETSTTRPPVPIALYGAGERANRKGAQAVDPCAACVARHLCLPGTLDEDCRRPLEGLTIGRRRVARGQTLYRAGDSFLFLYAVRLGTFKSGLTMQDGHDKVTAFHLTGDLLGFDGLADGTHPTTATALEAAEVCAIPYAQLMEACAQTQPLRQRVAQLMAIQLVRDYRSLKLVANCGSEKRVAGFLLEMAGSMRERGYSPREFLLRMSRADIGSYLGTTLETVSRCLSAFARLGLINVRSRNIELLRPLELLEYVNRDAG